MKKLTKQEQIKYMIQFYKQYLNEIKMSLKQLENELEEEQSNISKKLDN